MQLQCIDESYQNSSPKEESHNIQSRLYRIQLYIVGFWTKEESHHLKYMDSEMVGFLTKEASGTYVHSILFNNACVWLDALSIDHSKDTFALHVN